MNHRRMVNPYGQSILPFGSSFHFSNHPDFLILYYQLGFNDG
jgi:hypothetical protein